MDLVDRGRPEDRLAHEASRRRHATFSSDGRVFLIWGSSVRLWSSADGSPLSPLLDYQHGMQAAARSPDGTVVGTAGFEDRSAERNNQAPLSRVPAGTPIASAVSESAVLYLTFSPDGKTLLTAARDGTACFWSATDCKPTGVRLKHGGPLRLAAFRPDGQVVLTAGGAGGVRLWSAADGAAGPFIACGPSTGLAAFRSDGKVVLTTRRAGGARLWSTTDNEWAGVNSYYVADGAPAGSTRYFGFEIFLRDTNLDEGRLQV